MRWLLSVVPTIMIFDDHDLHDDRRRLMTDEAQWQWVTESSSTGGFDHLVLATSLPLLLPRGIHFLEAWNEAVCAGAWGNRLRPAAERLRQAVDLEHWAAFGASFRAFETLLTDLAGGSAGPASITVISGDIHHNYLAAVDLPSGPSSGTAVYQAVCSPLHNLLPERLRFGHRLVTSGFGALITTAAARLARVPAPRLRWRVTDGPWFANMLAELRYDGRQARIRFDRTLPRGPGIAGPPGLPGLELACEVELTPPATWATPFARTSRKPFGMAGRRVHLPDNRRERHGGRRAPRWRAAGSPNGYSPDLRRDLPRPALQVKDVNFTSARLTGAILSQVSIILFCA